MGTVSAPLAAKEVLDQNILKYTTVDPTDLARGRAMGLAYDGASATGVSSNYKAAQYLLQNKALPDYIERELRETSKYVYNLDPDIACKRSFSINAKICFQRQRNYQDALRRIEERSWYDDAKEAFKKKAGFEWPF
jgi:hypothetical protein